MFDINFISKPGLKENSLNDTWSFLKKNEFSDKDKVEKKVVKKISLFNKDIFKNYILLLVSLSLIVVMSFLNTSSSKFNSKAILEQVLDLMINTDYMDNFNLKTIEFNQKNILMLIELADISMIHGMEKLNKELSFEVYKKNKRNYLSILFTWRISEKGKNIEVVKSFMDEIIFSKEIIIKENDEIIYFHAKSSDMITFLLNMAENNQIQKFNFLISQHENNDYKLALYLN